MKTSAIRIAVGCCGAALMIAVVAVGGREIAHFAILGRIGDAPAGVPNKLLPAGASLGDAVLAAQFWSGPQSAAAIDNASLEVGAGSQDAAQGADGVWLLARISPDHPGAGASGGVSAAFSMMIAAALPPDASAGDAELTAEFFADRRSDAPLQTASLETGAAELPIVPPETAPAPSPGAAVPAPSGGAKEIVPRRPEPGYGSEAAQLYKKGDAAGLAALARAAHSPDEEVALEWASLRSDAHPSFAALAGFVAAHPGWPGGGWIRRRQEAEMAAHAQSPKKVAAFFAGEQPQSGAGMLAAARAANATGRIDEAQRIIRTVWREGDFDAFTESLILREFGALLARIDHKYRADRLLYEESFAPALRAAALAGPGVLALAKARIAAARGPLTLALALAVPPELRDDPGLMFARIQDARRSNRAYEAATLLDLAPRDPAALIDPGRWWSERRMVAQELLDLDEPRLAFETCDETVEPKSSADRVDAAFHAGWIALRFLGDAPAAADRFARAAEAAETPLAIARAAYWRGRAAEAMGQSDKAKVLYESAASEPIAYYGQLAAKRLGAKRLALRAPAAAVQGDERREAVRVVQALYADGLNELASDLAFSAAKEWREEAQLAAMAEVVKTYGEPVAQVEFGKIATNRGYAFDRMAFPTAGVPAFLPLAHSADMASIYAVARQESEFLWQASSGAGAKGLMQVMPATAASTARRAGVPFDYARLIVDPAFNTQLGAAFLGQVMEDEGGSRELAFAAYNAGGGRVAQWIAEHGDPRTGAVDLVDWIERIPFDETRDYVQRVSENLAVYRQRLAEDPPAPGPVPPRMARE